VELAFSHRAVAEQARREGSLTLQFLSERKPQRKWQAAADDGVAAIEALADVEDVHGPAAPAARPGLLTVHFGHEGVHVEAVGNGMSVLTVRGDDRVVRLDGPHRPDRNRLLAVTQMKEPADFELAVELHAAVLEAADPQHLA